MARSILRLVLKNNTVYEFQTDRVVAEAIAQHHEKGGVFFALNENDGLSVDFSDVRAVQITEDKVYPARIDAVVAQVAKKTIKVMDVDQINVDPTELEKILYKVDCKCGASYFVKLAGDTESCRCRGCGGRVFVDRAAPLIDAGKGKTAILATNKYRVPRMAKNENGGE